MTEIKEPTQGDNQKTLGKLKKENENLRRRIKELQKENSLLKEKLYRSEEKSIVTKEEKKPLKLFKKQKKEDAPDTPKTPKKADVKDSPKKQKAPDVSKGMDLEVSSDFGAPNVPLRSKYKTIINGDSRRMCPSCDNTQHKFIYEETDKTHIIMDYPRIYGKKFKCGKCGQEWRVPVVLE